MVNYALMITAELENLTNLEPQGGCDDPNFTYYIKVYFNLILSSTHTSISKFTNLLGF